MEQENKPTHVTPKITFEGIQIKSAKKFKLFCDALNTIEEECGIHSVEIEIKDIFFCPWIDTRKLAETPMECLILKMINELE